MRHTERLKQLVAKRAALIVPGAPNGLFARVVEDSGFDAIYATGAGIANMSLGAPDVGLTTVTEVAKTVSDMADAVDLPIIVDADTGFGNAVNTVRTVKLLERAGAAAIQIEDQVFPKKCGHFSCKVVVPKSEMVQKIQAAVDTRTDDDLILIARTDSRAMEGLDRAIDRAQAYIEAGADMTFVEAPRDAGELERIGAELSAPQVANIVFGGMTPDVGRDVLAANGFSIVLYANAALQAAVRASRDVLGSLREHGSLDHVSGKLASFEERQTAVAKDKWDGLEARYNGG